MMKTKEQRGNEIMDSIRRVLLDDWDPIGIKGFGPVDEYDHYIGGIYRLLTSHPSEDDVIQYLRRVETAQMGEELKDNEGLRSTAKKLLAINIAVEEQ